ncbi:MAG: HAMP domain-containing sensor histidine kinase, partial [Chloroflexi bacterium]|nr:HAMP domain-containing sensor histidine kinase [Chloroflexota bacterium]
VAAMLLNRRFHSIFEPEWLPATFIPLLALWGAWAGPQAAAMRLLLSLGALTGSALLWAAGWIFGGVYLDPTPIWLGVGLSYLGLAYWEIHTVNGLTRRQLARLRNEGAQLPELGQHADRIVNAAMWLLRPAGVALYAGAGRRLAAAGGVPAELPPTLSAESIRAQRWNGGDAPLRDWLTQRSVVYSPVYPLTPDGRRPLGWLTLFFPKDSPHVIMQGANYRLEPGAQALLTAFQHQAATLLPPAEPGRGADVVAQMATLLDLDRELLSQYGILTATSQHIADGVAACDLTGAIYFLNRAMAPLADTAEWLGGDMAGLLERVGLFPAGQGADRLRNLFSSPEPGQGEVTVNGRTWRVTLTRIDDVDARPLGIVTVFSDITDLRALDRARDEMMSFLSHELRTPLTSVMGAAALLAEVWTGDDETGPIALELLEGGARRMELLIDDLLQISRLEAGRLTLRPRMMEAEGALREALQLVQGAAAARHISFVQETESLTVEADPLRLVQVLTNLLSNAVKYSPEDATVRVCVQRTGEMAHFSVADQGAGIPQAEQRRLFTKFYRGSNVAQTTEGTGLGLVIVKRLVEMQGGEITVQSREGVGTTFAFTVPLASDDDGDEME